MPPKPQSNSRMNRIRKLLEQMGAGVYERDRVLALALLSAIAGESLFLLGLPGVGKSLVARRLKLAFHDARSFEYLMSRFSTPDEIFGPVSISRLKDCDTYERLTDGYLPSADIVFLDEIWKAGPSIQNALLTVLNERLFRNGDREMQLPLKGIIAASNELPARDEGLEALWDRFLLRLVVPPLESEEAFARMIIGTTAPTVEVEAALRITPPEYASWQPAIDRVEVGGAILAMIARIRALLKKGISTGEGEEAAPIYVSDRRWKKIVRLLRTAAFLNGREEVDPLDGFLISAAVWNEAEQIEPCTAAVDRTVAACIAEPFEREFLQLGERWQAVRVEAIRRAGRNRQFVSRFRIIDNRYYNLVGYAEGDTLIDIEEYNALHPHVAASAALSEVTHAGERLLSTAARPSRATSVSLTKDKEGLKINGVSYPLELVKDQELHKIYPEAPQLLDALDGELEALSDRIGHCSRTALAPKLRSPFVSEAQYKLLKSELARLTLRIRKMRNSLYLITADE